MDIMGVIGCFNVIITFPKGCSAVVGLTQLCNRCVRDKVTSLLRLLCLFTSLMLPHAFSRP